MPLKCDIFLTLKENERSVIPLIAIKITLEIFIFSQFSKTLSLNPSTTINKLLKYE